MATINNYSQYLTDLTIDGHRYAVHLKLPNAPAQPLTNVNDLTSLIQEIISLHKQPIPLDPSRLSWIDPQGLKLDNEDSPRKHSEQAQKTWEKINNLISPTLSPSTNPSALPPKTQEVTANPVPTVPSSSTPQDQIKLYQDCIKCYNDMISTLQNNGNVDDYFKNNPLAYVYPRLQAAYNEDKTRFPDLTLTRFLECRIDYLNKLIKELK